MDLIANPLRPLVMALAFYIIIKEVSLVDTAIGPSEDSVALLETIDIGAFVVTAISPLLEAQTVL